MNHGLTLGTIKGLENLADMVDQVALGGANDVLKMFSKRKILQKW